MKDLITIIKQSINDNNKHKQIQYLVTYLIMATISIIMAVLNLVYKQIGLAIATFAFSFFSFFNFLISCKIKKMINISKVLFVIQIFAMFIYFLISGGIEGFSLIWILLLPSCGLLIFGCKMGSILSFVILFCMLLFFYVPDLNAYIYPYSKTFIIRFPIVYTSTYVVSLFLELYRLITYNELKKTQEKFATLYSHDALTGARNRYGFNECSSQLVKFHQSSKIGVLMIDIDDFKLFNDTYGHMNGDIVLKEIVKNIKESINDKHNVYRWGGEEFVVMFFDGENAYKYATDIQATINSTPIILDNGEKVIVTSSMGLVVSNNINSHIELNSLVNKADELLYLAKKRGKNRLEYSEI